VDPPGPAPALGPHPADQHPRIRHTTLTWVEQNFGYAVARAYAGHTDSGSETGATATYVRANLAEVAAALVALTGEPHPLATTEGW
jgi:integrase/recombinase XerC